MEKSPIEIYTDGSCHTQLETGAWAAIVLWGHEKMVIQGEEHPTTHNRMELLAVINAIDFVVENYPGIPLVVYSDSQYVVKIPERKDKLKQNHFITKKGNVLPNADLIQRLITQIEKYLVTFQKVKAHQKTGSNINYNREVDLLVRELVRENVKRKN